MSKAETSAALDSIASALEGVRGTASNLQTRLDAGELPCGEGISFLDLQNVLMTTHCASLSSFIHEKLHGRAPDATVLDLCRTKTILEVLQPLQTKLRFQIHKLLSSAEREAAQAASSVALSAKPSIDDLDFSDEEGAGSGSGDDSDADPSKAVGVTASGSKIYKPPKLNAVHYMDHREREDARTDRQLRELERSRQSAVVREVQDELMGRPRNVEDTSGVGAEFGLMTKDELERQQYEEKYFLRLPVTKKMKLDRKRRQRALERSRTDLDHQIQGDTLRLDKFTTLQGDYDRQGPGSGRPGLGEGLGDEAPRGKMRGKRPREDAKGASFGRTGGKPTKRRKGSKKGKKGRS